MKKKVEDKFDFEKSMEELESIVKELENGDLSLDKSIEVFQKGIELSKLCTKKLDEVEKRVTILLESEDGELNELPFSIEEG